MTIWGSAMITSSFAANYRMLSQSFNFDLVTIKTDDSKAVRPPVLRKGWYRQRCAVAAGWRILLRGRIPAVTAVLWNAIIVGKHGSLTLLLSCLCLLGRMRESLLVSWIGWLGLGKRYHQVRSFLNCYRCPSGILDATSSQKLETSFSQTKWDFYSSRCFSVARVNENAA